MQPSILVTNDDGIDAPGLAALHEELTAVGDVTVVAPADDQSGVGRARNSRAVRRDHPWGYALEGAPADCVAYGLSGLDREFDLVVSGVNAGPNAGNYVVGRSGTVGAGVEAAFLDTPAVAVSAYHAQDFYTFPPEEYDFGRPARVAARLADRVLGAADALADVDLLNVNAPVDVADPRVRLTEPYADYGHRVSEDPAADDESVERDLADGEAVVALEDSVWPDTVGFQNPFPLADDHRDRYPPDSDRRALMDGAVSVSPLSVSHRAVRTDAVAALLETLAVE